MVARIICKEQSSFIKGRFILDNLIIVWEGLKWAWETGQKVLLLKIDFDKAYDRVKGISFSTCWIYWDLAVYHRSVE